MKKIFLFITLAFSLVFATSCIGGNNNNTNETEKINLVGITTITVLKDVTIENGNLQSKYKSTIELGSNEFLNLKNIEFLTKEPYSGPTSYKYVIVLNSNINIYVIDNTTFIYNNHKAVSQNTSFSFLENLTFNEVAPKTEKFDLSNVTKITVLKDVTIENGTLKSKYKTEINKNTNEYTNLLNIEYIAKEEESDLTKYSYAIILETSDIKINILIVDANTFVLNNLKNITYNCDFSFIESLTYTPTDPNGSGWLPWV